VNLGVRAPLVELFWSVQGEGRFVGVPMAFLRTATCPIRCLYCDTQHSYTATAHADVQGQPKEQNPVTAERAAELLCGMPVAKAARNPRVSITGGEPLVFPGFIKAVGERVRPLGFRVHLETAALDPLALQHCIAQVDHLSADYKLPGTLRAGFFGRQHVECCAIALRAGVTVDIKLVLMASIGEAAFSHALTELDCVREQALLILQPVTPCGEVHEKLPPEVLQRCIDATEKAGFDFRVLPQVHKQLQVP
jgi:organic radical activating enzyme